MTTREKARNDYDDLPAIIRNAMSFELFLVAYIQGYLQCQREQAVSFTDLIDRDRT